MQQNLRIVSLSDFRKNAPRLTDWIRQAEGRIWVTKHGKTVCGVVPLDQLEMIEKLEGRSRAEERERFARGLQHLEIAKGVGDGYGAGPELAGVF